MKGQKISFRKFHSSPLMLPADTREGGALGLKDGESSWLWRDRQRQTSSVSVTAQSQKQTAHHIRLLSVKHLDLSMSIFCSSSLHLLRSFSSSCLSSSTLDSSLSFLSSSSETDNCDQTICHVVLVFGHVWSWQWAWGQGGSARNRNMMKREREGRLHLSCLTESSMGESALKFRWLFCHNE